jgi:hypothetical protein
VIPVSDMGEPAVQNLLGEVLGELLVGPAELVRAGVGDPTDKRSDEGISWEVLNSLLRAIVPAPADFGRGLLEDIFCKKNLL